MSNRNSQLRQDMKKYVWGMLAILVFWGMLCAGYMRAHAVTAEKIVYVSDWENFKAALEENSDTKIIVDHYITENSARPIDGTNYVIDVKGNHILDLNNHDIRIRTKTHRKDGDTVDMFDRELYLLHMGKSTNLHIIDSSGDNGGLLKFHAYIGENWHSIDRSLFLVDGGQLTIDGGSYEAGRSKKAYESWYAEYEYRMISGSVAAIKNSGKMTVNGGHYETREFQGGTLLFSIDNKSSLTIYDGYFDNRNAGSTGEHGSLIAADANLFNVAAGGELALKGGAYRLGYYGNVAYGGDGCSGKFHIPADAVDFEAAKVRITDGPATTEITGKETLRDMKEEYRTWDKMMWIIPYGSEKNSVLENVEISYVNMYGLNLGSECITLDRGFNGSFTVDADTFRYYDTGEMEYEWSIFDEASGEYKRIRDVNGTTDLSTSSLFARAHQSFTEGGGFTEGEYFTLSEMEIGEYKLRCSATERLNDVSIKHVGYFELSIEDTPKQDIEVVEIGLEDSSRYFTADGYLRTQVSLKDFAMKALLPAGAEEYQYYIDDTIKIQNLTDGYELNEKTGFVPEMGKKYLFTVRILPLEEYRVTSATEIRIPKDFTKTVSLSADDIEGGWLVSMYAYSNAPEFINSCTIPLNGNVYDHDENRLISRDNTKIFDGIVFENEKYRIEELCLYEDGEKAVTAHNENYTTSHNVSNGHCYYFTAKLAVRKELIGTDKECRFDTVGVYSIGNSRCTVTVSEDGYSAELKSGLMLATCNHSSDAWITTDEAHGRECALCGAFYAKGTHIWTTDKTSTEEMNGNTVTTTYYSCEICGETKIIVDGAAHLNKVQIMMQNPVAGETIRAPYIADEENAGAYIENYLWVKNNGASATDNVVVTADKDVFEAGHHYYLMLFVKAKDGYFLDRETILSGYYMGKAPAKDMEAFGYAAEDYYQTLASDGSLSTVLKTTTEVAASGSAVVTLPDVTPGDSYAAFLKGLNIEIKDNPIAFGASQISIFKDTKLDAFGQTAGTYFYTKHPITGVDLPGSKDTLFDENASYVVRIPLTFIGVTVPAENITVRNGKAAIRYEVVDGVTGPEIIATYVMDSLSIGSVTLSGVKAPVLGEKPFTDGITAYEKVTVVEAVWSEKTATTSWSETMAYACGGAYTLTVKVKPNPGFRFANEITASVNGAAAVATAGEDGTVTVQYTFPRIMHMPAGNPVVENETAATAASEGGYDLVTRCVNCNAVLSAEHVKLGKLHSITVEQAAHGTASASKTEAGLGTVVSLKAIPDEGYMLTGWRIIGGGISVKDNVFEVGSKDVVVRPVFTYIKNSGESKNSISLSIYEDGTVGLNYYIYLTKVEAENVKQARVYFDGEIRTISFDPDNFESADGNGSFYKFNVPMNAAQLRKTIDFVLYDYDGTKMYSFNNSASYYCYSLLSDSKYSQYDDIVKALLNYGTAAQMYFEYGMETPANYNLTSADREVPVPAVDSLPAPADTCVLSNGFDKLTYAGATLSIESAIKLRLYLQAGEGLDGTGGINTSAYNVVVKNAAGDICSNASLRTVMNNAYAGYVEIPDISVTNLDEVYTVFITDANTGEYMKLTYSPTDYVRILLSGGDTRFEGTPQYNEYPKLEKLIAALYHLYEASVNMK